MTLKLFFCVLFITCCFTVSLAQVPADCCLSVKNKAIPKIAIVGFHQQFRGQGCSIDATILVTRGGHRLCVPADEPWVGEVIDFVNCKKQHKKPSTHCFGKRQKKN